MGGGKEWREGGGVKEGFVNEVQLNARTAAHRIAEVNRKQGDSIQNTYKNVSTTQYSE